MMPWKDLTVEQKLDRLAELAWKQQKQIAAINQVIGTDRITGYELLRVTTTPEAIENWIGVKNG